MTRSLLLLAVAGALSAARPAHAQPEAPATTPTAPATPAPDAAEPTTPLDDEAADVEAVADDAGAEANQVPDLDKLGAPDSPAFVLLGVAPTTIQRPTTPRELAISLSSFVSGSDDITVPDNLAVEVAPFWLWSHGDLTFEDYAAGDLAQLLRNLTFSVGTRGREVTLTDAMGDETTRNDVDLSAGFRTQMGSRADLAACTKLDDALIGFAKNTALGVTPDQLAAMKPEELNALKQRRVDKVAQLTEELDEIRTACAAASSTRKLSVAAAGAVGWHFPGAVAKDGDLDRAAGWLTFAYTRAGADSVLALARIAGEQRMSGWQTFADAGVRAVIARSKYAASLEVIGRVRLKGADTDSDRGQYRVAGAVDYMVRNGIWVTVSIGKDFAGSDAGSLFSLANLTWGFGEPKIKKPGA